MKRAFAVTVLAVLALLAAQCKKKRNDEAAIQRLVASDTTFFYANTSSDTTHDTTFVQLGKDTAVVWWRSARYDSNPQLDISVTGDSAYVELTRHLHGYLNALVKVPDTTWQLWTKRLLETVKIRGIYLRTGPYNEQDYGWRLHKVSLTTGNADSITDGVRIDSLRINSETNPNIVINDPLNTYYRVDSLIRFTSAEYCTLTLYTNAADANAFLQTFLMFWYVRAPFSNLGNGVFRGVWRTQWLEIPRFAIFDLIDHRALYSPDGAYNVNRWLLPYRIKNTD